MSSLPAAEAGEILWEPDDAFRQASGAGMFLAWLADARRVSLVGYDALWHWSTERPEEFWSAVWEYYGAGTHPPVSIRDAQPMPATRWFSGARVNYAQEMLARAASDGPALIAISEDEKVRELTGNEIRGQVGALAATLTARGVSKGDRVAAYLPNVPEAVIGLLATAAIGAIWVSCAPDFGADAVISRFSQVEPSVLLTVTTYRFGGRDHDRSEAVRRLRDELRSVHTTIVLGDAPSQPEAITWEQAVGSPCDPIFEDIEFSDPLWVLFSSGTTGAPKGIVHSHGGIVLEHLKSLGLGSDVRAGDRFYFYSSTTWMVWNWLVGGMLVGAIPILYDGSPGYPDVLGSWRVAASAGANIFGSGAAYLLACEKAEITLRDELDLGALRTVISTGSPLPLATWRWLYDQLDGDIRLDSSCGGTDICSGLLSGSPLLPVYLGEIARPCLGVRAKAFDEDGAPIVGALGELVITEPIPSMPVEFWNDPDGTRYRSAYFEKFPGVWCHGDWVEFTSRGSVVVAGRSDSTLNRAGVRMGSSDIYSIVDTVAGVRDSLVLGIELRDGGYYMPLFVVPEAGRELPEIEEAIRDAIRARLSPRHLPDEVILAPAIPRTTTGKRLEVPLKRLVMGDASVASAAVAAGARANDIAWYATFGQQRIGPLLA